MSGMNHITQRDVFLGILSFVPIALYGQTNAFHHVTKINMEYCAILELPNALLVLGRQTLNVLNEALQVHTLTQMVQLASIHEEMD